MLLDEVSIKELLSILIDNAIKHSYKNRIFERFYRVDKSRNRNNN